MGFLSVVHSDTGIHKDMNQDAVLIKEAETDYGKVMLAVVCDGMGGLSRGEVASAALIRAFSDWFETRFPDLLYTQIGVGNRLDGGRRRVKKYLWSFFKNRPGGAGQAVTCSTSGMGLRLK